MSKFIVVLNWSLLSSIILHLESSFFYCFAFGVVAFFMSRKIRVVAFEFVCADVNFENFVNA